MEKTKYIKFSINDYIESKSGEHGEYEETLK